MTEIVIRIGEEEFAARLGSGSSPETAERIVAALPIESVTREWGDEFYFEVPVEADEENARSAVAVGDVAYWPAGRSLCIFFGPTPMSSGPDEIVPASPVNVVGRVDNPEGMRRHTSGEAVTIRRAV
jgi:hypothetical protein